MRQLEELVEARFRAIGLGTDLDLHPEISRETALLLQELGDAIPTPLFFKNRGGVFTFCNRALADLLGLERESIVGHRLGEFIPGALAGELEERGRRLLEGEEPQFEEHRLPRADGAPLDVQIHRCVLRDGRGEVVGLVGTVLDLRLQRRTVGALRESEARYRGLFESALDGIFIMEGDRFVEANGAAARIFGRPIDELVGLRPMELSPERQPDGRLSTDKALEKIQNALSGRRQFFEWAHLRADGSTFDAEVSLSPLELENGTYILAIVRDITDRKRTEAALKASEEFNRGMIQHAPMGVMYVDMDGVLVYENPTMERMMGVPKGSSSLALGRKLRDLPGLSAVPIDELLARVARGEIVRNLEVDYLSVYEARSQLLVQISPHADAAGRVIGAIFMIQDVTELRNLEQQLRQAQKLDAIGSLAGGLAHDFNNLLTGVIGNAELALQHVEDPVEVRRHLQDQLAIAQRAAELTRRLLTFSRQQETAPGPLHLSRLIDGLEMMLRRLIGEAVTLDWEPAPALWALRADAGQVEQVIVNLVVNARDAMPDGGRLRVRARNVELSPAQARRVMGVQPGPHVLLEVADTGCGIDETLRARIFEPFFTTKTLGKGTGLGLSIVYAILKKCGGGVALESEPGRGSVFRLYFPSLGEPAAAEPEPREEAAGLLRGNETVLVIEDEPAVRELSVRLLEHCGYRVWVAGDGQAALELARRAERPADLIFSDVIMPGLSGPAAVRQILELWPGARVLFCSGYTDGELARHDLSPAAGAPLLNKPFTLETLSRRVRQALDGAAVQ